MEFNSHLFILSYFSLAFTKAVKIKNQEFYLRLVDTAGQDEYSIFPAQYAVDIHGYVLVYRYKRYQIGDSVSSNYPC